MISEIIIKGLKIYAYHGVNEEEKINGQNFIIDVNMKINRSEYTDNINSTVSYSKVAKEIKKIALEQKYDLIETLAEKIAKELLKEFDMIQNIEIIVKKPEAPMKLDFEYTAVKISRSKGDYNIE